jgi:hypothetical protein
MKQNVPESGIKTPTKNDKIREQPERRKKNEIESESRARTGRDRKGEDDCYFKK